MGELLKDRVGRGIQGQRDRVRMNQEYNGDLYNRDLDQLKQDSMEQRRNNSVKRNGGHPSLRDASKDK